MDKNFKLYKIMTQ